MAMGLTKVTRYRRSVVFIQLVNVKATETVTKALRVQKSRGLPFAVVGPECVHCFARAVEGDLQLYCGAGTTGLIQGIIAAVRVFAPATVSFVMSPSSKGICSNFLARSLWYRFGGSNRGLRRRTPLRRSPPLARGPPGSLGLHPHFCARKSFLRAGNPWLAPDPPCSVSFFRYRLISTLRFASLYFGFISISLWQTDWLDIRCSVEKPAHTGRISVRYALALLPHCSRLSFLSFSLAHSALTFQLFSVLGRWVGDQFLVGCFLATFQTPCFDSLSLISLTSCLRFQRQGNRCFRSLA